MRSSTRMGLACATALGLAFLVASSRLHASEPFVETFSFVDDNVPFADCGDFVIIANGAGTGRLTTYFDRYGQPVRLLFQGHYDGSLTNSETGAFVLDSPSVANTFIDLVAGTETDIGTFFNVTIPGTGTVLIEAGRIVFDGSGPPVFIAGPHRPPDEQVSILCDALR